MLRDLRLALALLTVLPLAPKGVGEEDFKRSVAFFPLAGYLLGLPLALLALLPLPPGLSAALGVALLLGLTGFLHLDGLLDLADALLGARPREERLRILKDPHRGAGAGGVGGGDRRRRGAPAAPVAPAGANAPLGRVAARAAAAAGRRDDAPAATSCPRRLRAAFRP